MKRDDAKRLILAKWDSWSRDNAPDNPTGRDALAFYAHLRENHPRWLTFRYPGDRWQAVHSWLIRANKVSD